MRVPFLRVGREGVEAWEEGIKRVPTPVFGPLQVNGKYTHGSMRNAGLVAQEYKVSPKTIRDIWNRYSWAKVTRPMWTEQEGYHYSANYVLRGHQGNGTGPNKSMHATVVGGGGAAANRPPAAAAVQHHAVHQPATSSHFVGGLGHAAMIGVPQQMAGMVRFDGGAAQQAPAQDVRVKQDPIAGHQASGAVCVPSAGWAPTSNAYTLMCQAGGAPVESSSSFRSSVDDIGMGSSEMLQFNQEVDQMIGLPSDIMPTRMASCGAVDMSCGVDFGAVSKADEGVHSLQMPWMVKPTASKLPGEMSSCHDFDAGLSFGWGGPSTYNCVTGGQADTAGASQQQSDMQSKLSSDLDEQMMQSQKRLNDLLNMNGLPAYNGGSFVDSLSGSHMHAGQMPVAF